MADLTPERLAEIEAIVDASAKSDIVTGFPLYPDRLKLVACVDDLRAALTAAEQRAEVAECRVAEWQAEERERSAEVERWQAECRQLGRQLVGLREAVEAIATSLDMVIAEARRKSEQNLRDAGADLDAAEQYLGPKKSDPVAVSLRAAIADAAPIADHVIAEAEERGAKWGVEAARARSPHNPSLGWIGAADGGREDPLDPVEICRRAREAGGR